MGRITKHNFSKYCNICVYELIRLGDVDGKASQLAREANLNLAPTLEEAAVVLVDDFTLYQANMEKLNQNANAGKTILFLELPAGEYKIAETTVSVEKTSMGNYYFVSPNTEHKLVGSFKPFDFRFWYDEKKDLISPIIANTVNAPDWNPLLSSGATNWIADSGEVLAAGELKYDKGTFRICELQLINKLQFNPTAYLFLNELLNN